MIQESASVEAYEKQVRRVSDSIALRPLIDVIARMREDVCRGVMVDKKSTRKKIPDAMGSYQTTTVIHKRAMMYAHNYSGYDAFHCLPSWCEYAERNSMRVAMVLHKRKIYALDIT